MEQFRQIGEVLGGMKAMMALQDDNQINRRQCSLLLDAFNLAFLTITTEIKQNLRLEERNTKWTALEEPLMGLYFVFKEGELYVRRCLDNKDWWAKAVSFHRNRDSVEFHIHNLFCCFPAVIEAIEIASEISGLDQGETQKKKIFIAKKYDRCWFDYELFVWRYGDQYLLPSEISKQIEDAVREDQWLLTELIKKKQKEAISKNQQRLGDILLKKLNGTDKANGKLPPSSVLLGSETYQIKRRFGAGNQYKKIHWFGEGFVLRHIFQDIKPLSSEISTLLSLSHPNIVQYLCGFYDEEKKECFLVLESMTKDLYTYLKENISSRRCAILPLPVVVDVMLQIARGMEYLHSKGIYVGDLNPTNIFLKPRKSMEGYFYAKVSGFGLTSYDNSTSKPPSPKQNALDPNIWYAPEVLAEVEQQQQQGSTSPCSFTLKLTEKADVYSFGMLCFELLTGKLPFEDSHLQGEKMIKNIRAGERPLFPFQTPKYLVNLTKKCWHNDPNYRPSFSSICRILRYAKKFLLMNPDDDQPETQLPPVDFCDLETMFLKKQPTKRHNSGLFLVLQVPFQMFVYKLLERERSGLTVKTFDFEANLNGLDEAISEVDDPIVDSPRDRISVAGAKTVCFDIKSIYNEVLHRKKSSKPSDLRSICSEPPKKRITIARTASHLKLERTSSSLKLERATSGKQKNQLSPKRPAGNKLNKENSKKRKPFV